MSSDNLTGHVHIRVPPEILEEVAQAAADLETDRSAVIRLCLEECSGQGGIAAVARARKLRRLEGRG